MSLEDLLQKREHKDYAQITIGDIDKAIDDLALKSKLLNYQMDMLDKDIELLRVIIKEWADAK